MSYLVCPTISSTFSASFRLIVRCSIGWSLRFYNLICFLSAGLLRRHICWMCPFFLLFSVSLMKNVIAISVSRFCHYYGCFGFYYPIPLPPLLCCIFCALFFFITRHVRVYSFLVAHKCPSFSAIADLCLSSVNRPHDDTA